MKLIINKQTKEIEGKLIEEPAKYRFLNQFKNNKLIIPILFTDERIGIVNSEDYEIIEKWKKY